MKSYVETWGWSIEKILKMPRRKFAAVHGERFLSMSNSKFLKTLKKETLDLYISPASDQPRWQEDTRADKDLCEQLHESFAWDEPSTLI